MQNDKKRGIIKEAISIAVKPLSIPKKLGGAIAGFVKDKTEQIKSETLANRGANKLTDTLMGPAKGKTEDRFPSHTTIGDAKWDKRRDEIKGMVKSGKMNQAKSFIANKRKEYDELNQ